VPVVVLPAWTPERMTAGTFRTRAPAENSYRGPAAFFDEYLSVLSADEPLLFYDDDPTATVAVTDAKGEGRAILVNGKSDSSIPGDRLTTGLIALLPALLARGGERAFVIGYGTGWTTGELAALTTMREVVVAEISPGVLAAARFFEGLNQGAATNPKTRLLRRDAYRALSHGSGTFDVITSEPSNPWVAGVEMLYSVEFLRTARERLAPGGVYLQWFHVYETDDATVALVLRTFRQVFPRSALWIGKRNDLLLVGFADDAVEPLDAEELERRWSRPDLQAGFRRAGIETLPGLLAHEALPLGVLERMELPGEVHTLLKPTLNHVAALAFFAGQTASLPPSIGREAAEAGARSSLFRRWRAARGGSLSNEEWSAVIDEACEVDPLACATFFAAWHREHTGSPVLAERLAALRAESTLARPLSSANLARIVALFSAEGTVGPQATYEVASRVEEVFKAFYHHAVPFDAAALHGPWERCRADPRCAEQLPRILSQGGAKIVDGPGANPLRGQSSGADARAPVP
jgi:spermidine synthase